jgi:hypothetical protein
LHGPQEQEGEQAHGNQDGQGHGRRSGRRAGWSWQNRIGQQRPGRTTAIPGVEEEGSGGGEQAFGGPRGLLHDHSQPVGSILVAPAGQNAPGLGGRIFLRGLPGKSGLDFPNLGSMMVQAAHPGGGGQMPAAESPDQHGGPGRSRLGAEEIRHSPRGVGRAAGTQKLSGEGLHRDGRGRRPGQKRKAVGQHVVVTLVPIGHHSVSHEGGRAGAAVRVGKGDHQQRPATLGIVARAFHLYRLTLAHTARGGMADRFFPMGGVP